MKHLLVLTPLALLVAAGCISVKTENEIKPIHITMDVNLKVDKQLDKAFSDENHARPKGNFQHVKDLLDRHAGGITAQALLEPRTGATDDDKILIAEENGKRMKRFQEIADSSGVSLQAVQKRYARMSRERIPAGIWYQDDGGTWRQK